MTLTPAQTHALRALADRLSAAPRGLRSALVRDTALALGLSVTSVYRRLKEMDVTGKRKTRSDAGRRKVDRDLALLVGGLVHTAQRANDKRTTTIKEAVRIVADNGLGVPDPETGEIVMPSVSTVARAMRAMGCHPSQLGRGKATGRMRSPHPNWMWQVDASVCVLYYLPGGRMSVLDERIYNARKPGRLADIGDQRITRYVVVDHCTGYLYVRYALERGESATGVLTTLIEAMSDRGPRDPMHGVPLHLYADKGSGNRNGLITEFCERLGVKLLYHAAGTANATGAVEKAQDIVERHFEGRLRFTEISQIEQIQALADRWRRHFNAHAVHTRLRVPRSVAWLRITDDQLRTASRDALIAISHWPVVERTVARDMTVRVDTRLPQYGVQVYDLRNLAYAGLSPSDKVRVELNPFRAPAVIVIKTMPDGTERRWDVEPIQRDEWGFDAAAPVAGLEYRSLPDTVSDKSLKDIAERAAPTEQVRHPYPDIDIMADLREAPLSMRPAGRDVLGRPPVAETVLLTHMQASLRLKDRQPEAFERNAVGCMDYILQQYPDRVPEDKLDELAAEIGRRFGPVRPATYTTFNMDGPARAMGGAS